MKLNTKTNKPEGAKKTIFARISLLAISFSVFLLLGCGSDVVKIGVMLPLTGDAGSYGQSVKKGIDLARSVSESAIEIELVVEDSQCTGTEAVKAMNKLATADGVIAVIGELCSSATLAAAPIAEENGVVLISPASTSPKLTYAGDFIFRSISSDSFQGAYAASIIADAGIKKIAVLHPNDDYGVGIAGVLETEFAANGGEVVAVESFERGSTDLRAQVLKIKAADPEAIYIVSNSPDAALAAVRQISELGLSSMALYGSEGLKDPALAELPSADGLIITSVSAGNNTYTSDYLAFYGGDAPGQFSAQGYDAYMLLQNAVEAGAKTGDEVKEYLYNNSLEGASGFLEFDENGDLSVGAYDLYVVRDGEFQLLNR